MKIEELIKIVILLLDIIIKIVYERIRRCLFSFSF